MKIFNICLLIRDVIDESLIARALKLPPQVFQQALFTSDLFGEIFSMVEPILHLQSRAKNIFFKILAKHPLLCI